MQNLLRNIEYIFLAFSCLSTNRSHFLLRMSRLAPSWILRRQKVAPFVRQQKRNKRFPCFELTDDVFKPKYWLPRRSKLKMVWTAFVTRTWKHFFPIFPSKFYILMRIFNILHAIGFQLEFPWRINVVVRNIWQCGVYLMKSDRVFMFDKCIPAVMEPVKLTACFTIALVMNGLMQGYFSWQDKLLFK